MTKSPGVIALLFAAVALAACGDTGTRWSTIGQGEGLRLSVTADSLPPYAQDDFIWKVQVRDQKTGMPVEGGQGSVWARNKDGHEVNNGLAQAPELGVYNGKLRLVMAGQWQMGVVFRRDSTTPFVEVDWVQEVRAPRPLGG